MGKVERVVGVGVIRKRELIPFTRQVSSMLNAGMSILTAVATIEEQVKHPGFKRVLEGVRESVESGEAFSQGLQRFPQIFDELYINMVYAGERSGQFAAVLRRLAIMLDSSARLVRKVKSAMMYPAVIMSLAVLISAGLIVFIVPVFKEMFEGFDAELPGATQFLVDVSNFLRAHYVAVPLGLVGVVMGFRWWYRSKGGRVQFDTLVLRLPVFGDLVQKVSIARFCRLFAQMITSGVPILDAMQVVANSIGNKVIEGAIMEARVAVEQGNTLSASLEGKRCLPVMMVRMIAAGEKSGRLDEMLESVADTYDDEVEVTLASLTSLMEPLLMVFLGVMVGGIVISLFMPIFKLGSVIGG